MVPKCGSLLRTQENNKKVQLWVNAKPQESCETRANVKKKKQKNRGSKYGSMLTSYENHGEVEELVIVQTNATFP